MFNVSHSFYEFGFYLCYIPCHGFWYPFKFEYYAKRIFRIDIDIDIDKDYGK